MGNYEKDKAALSQSKARLLQSEKHLKHLEWENEVSISAVSPAQIHLNLFKICSASKQLARNYQDLRACAKAAMHKPTMGQAAANASARGCCLALEHHHKLAL